MADLKPIVRRGSIWVLTSNIIRFPLSFVSSWVLVRFLTTKDYGTYRLLLSLLVPVQMTTSLGINPVLSRYVPEYLEREKKRDVGRLLGLAVLTRIAALIVILGVALAQRHWVFSFLNVTDVFREGFFLASLFFIVNGTTQVFGPGFHSSVLDYKTTTITTTIQRLLLTSLLVVASVWGLGFHGVLLALVIAEAAAFLAFGRSAVQTVRGLNRQQGDGHDDQPLELRRIIRFGVFSALLTSVGLVQEASFDNIIISHYLDADSVALYGFAFSMVSLASYLNPITMGKGIFSYIFVRKYVEKQDKEVLTRGSAFVVRMVLFVMLPLLSTLCLLAEPITSYIFNPQYLPAVPVVYLLALYRLAAALTYAYGYSINTLELVQYRFYGTVFSVYNIVMAIVLIPSFGIVGVGFATASTALLTLFYLVIVAKVVGKVRVGFPYLSVLKIVLSTAIVAGLFLASRLLVQSAASLLLVMAAGAVLYLGASALLRPFLQEERETINAVLGRKLWVF